MSRRGNCWDNAPQESFFGHLKDHVKSRCYSSLNDLQREIDRLSVIIVTIEIPRGIKKDDPVHNRNHLLSAA